VIDAWPLSCERVTCDFFQAGHIVRGSASAAIPRSTCSLLGARVHPGAVGFSVPSAIWFTLPRPCASLRLLILSPASCVASISAPSVPLSSHGRPRIGDLASAALGLGSDLRRHWSCRQLHRTCRRISSFLHIDSYRGGHHGLIGPWLLSTWTSQAAVIVRQL